MYANLLQACEFEIMLNYLFKTSNVDIFKYLLFKLYAYIIF